jgi:hypothetical protein
MADVGERPSWDDALARSLLGRHVLVGLTFERPNGEMIEQVQLHGTVARIDAYHGLGSSAASPVSSSGSRPIRLRSRRRPRASTAYARRVRWVVDLDLLSTWTITQPDDDALPDWRLTLCLGFEPAG